MFSVDCLLSQVKSVYSLPDIWTRNTRIRGRALALHQLTADADAAVQYTVILDTAYNTAQSIAVQYCIAFVCAGGCARDEMGLGLGTSRNRERIDT